MLGMPKISYIKMDRSRKSNIFQKFNFFVPILLAGMSIGLSCLNQDSSNIDINQSDTSFEENYFLAIGNTDIAVGTNRIIFSIIDKINGPIILEEVRVNYYYLDPKSTFKFHAPAKFVKWPASNKGVYVSHTSFDKAGKWGVSVITPDGMYNVQAGIVVKDRSDSPSIGKLIPSSTSKTSKDVSDLSQLTTSLIPNPKLYELSIDEAISNGKSTVLTFATPAFCSTATCGPQVEIISSLSTLYKGNVNFIHIEIYEHPHEISGNPSNATMSPIVMEWGIKTEPFTFVIDNDGVLRYKYEGFVTKKELIKSIDKITKY